MTVCEFLQSTSVKSSYLTLPDMSFLGPVCDNVDHLHVNMTKKLVFSHLAKTLSVSVFIIFRPIAMLIHCSLTCLEYLELTILHTQ